MRIRTNVSSLKARRFANLQSENVEASQRKLSSGKRITHSGDDTASLSLSSKNVANIASSQMANRNANDAISILQVAEGSLSILQNIITRVRELAIQSASDTYSDHDREYLDIERDQLMKEVDRLAQSTEFNDNKLLNGSKKELSIAVGIHNTASDRININLTSLAQDIHSLGLYDVDLKSARHAQKSLSRLDYALTSLSESRAKIGASQSRLKSSGNNLTTSNENMSESNSRLIDTDYAVESANNVSSKLKLEVAMEMVKVSNVSRNRVLQLID
jgi:flagellin